MAVLEITDAEGGPMVTVMEFDLEHPFEFVSVNVYVEDEVGETLGFEIVEVNPDGELVHE